jgi:rfaE bifunctional protein kinase chain/domain
VTAADFWARARALRILVVGDLMLDRYLWGRVSRISPEAPVPVVDVVHEDARLGGAANVALNLRALGASVTLCGSIGTDANGVLFASILAEQGLSAEGLIRLDTRPTTTKTRILGGSQQMLRVDRELSAPLPPAEAQAVLQRLEQLLAPSAAGGAAPYDAIVFEDYDKGLLAPELIAAVIGAPAVRAGQIPVLVDPKFRNFFAYAGCTVFKPNVKELGEALGQPLDRADVGGLKAAVSSLRQRMPHALTLLTLSERGVLLADAAGGYHHLPAHVRQIVDVSGAGDTVVSVMAVALAAGLAPPAAAALANLAGGLVCESVGVVPISAERLAAEAQAEGVLA